MALPEYDKLTLSEAEPAHADAANLPTVDETDASPQVKELYQRFRENFGRTQVPGILQCFATHPPLLQHMMGIAKEMLFIDGALGRQDKELISTFVSASNACAYCSDSHAYSLRIQGGSPAAAASALACDANSEAISPQQRSLLRFVQKVTQDSVSVRPADIEAMRKAGWTDLQIAEAIHVTALFATFNRVVNAFGLPSQQLLSKFEQENKRA